MSSEQALKILVQAAFKANKAGVFELSESGLISQAVDVFTKKQDGTNPDNTSGSTEEKQEEVPSEESPKKS